MDPFLNTARWAWRAAPCALLLAAPVWAARAHPGGHDQASQEQRIVEEQVIELVGEAPASQSEGPQVRKRLVIERVDGEAGSSLAGESEDGAAAHNHVRIRIVKRTGAQDGAQEMDVDVDKRARGEPDEDRREVEIEASDAPPRHKRVEIRRRLRGDGSLGEGAAAKEITLDIDCAQAEGEAATGKGEARARKGDAAELGEVEPRLQARCKGSAQGDEQDEIVAAIRTAREEIAADEALDEELRAQILAELDALIAEHGDLPTPSARP